MLTRHNQKTGRATIRMSNVTAQIGPTAVLSIRAVVLPAYRHAQVAQLKVSHLLFEEHLLMGVFSDGAALAAGDGIHARSGGRVGPNLDIMHFQGWCGPQVRRRHTRPEGGEGVLQALVTVLCGSNPG